MGPHVRHEISAIRPACEGERGLNLFSMGSGEAFKQEKYTCIFFFFFYNLQIYLNMNQRYMDKAVKHCQINYLFKAILIIFQFCIFYIFEFFFYRTSVHTEVTPAVVSPASADGPLAVKYISSLERTGAGGAITFPVLSKGSSSLPVSVVRSASSQGSALAATAFLRRTLPNNC